VGRARRTTGTLREEIDRQSSEMAPKAGLSAVPALATVAAYIGFVMYRRPRSLMELSECLQDAFPEAGELLASLKRPLERAVKFKKGS
jgi:hypothetical protein